MHQCTPSDNPGSGPRAHSKHGCGSHCKAWKMMATLVDNNAATSQGHALEVGEESKRSSHSCSCYTAGISFVLLVVETFGSWSSDPRPEVGAAAI